MRALDALIAAAEAYGDAAKLSRETVYGWKRGDDMSPMKAANKAHQDAEWALRAAARAYATATRKSRAKRLAVP